MCLPAYVDVLSRRFEGAVTEKNLERTDIETGLHGVCGKTVAERVRLYVLGEASVFDRCVKWFEDRIIR